MNYVLCTGKYQIYSTLFGLKVLIYQQVVTFSPNIFDFRVKIKLKPPFKISRLPQVFYSQLKSGMLINLILKKVIVNL